MAAKTILVHGFGYDPEAEDRDNPENYTFPRWRDMLGDPGAVGYSWYSVPFGYAGLLNSWFSGRWNRYRHAWDLAQEEGYKLRYLELLSPVRGERGDIVCHSLGSKVVLDALNTGLDMSLYVGKVLIMGGAATSEYALRVAKKQPNIEFYSTVVREDDILHKLGRFAPGCTGAVIGQAGLGELAPENWVDIRMDNKYADVWAQQGFTGVSGDSPTSIADHWYVFENENNWPLYRAILKGELQWATW